MIGRFIHHQHVGLVQQQLRQRHAGPLAAGQHADELILLIAAEQQGPQHVADHLGVQLSPGRHFLEGGVSAR